MAAAWAASPVSSRPFPHPGSSIISPLFFTSLRGILSPAAGLAHLGLLSGVPEVEVGSSHRLDSFQAYRKVTECPRVLPNSHCPASAANMLLYRICTVLLGIWPPFLATRSVSAMVPHQSSRRNPYI